MFGKPDAASQPLCKGAKNNTAHRCESGDNNGDESLRLWACDAWKDKSAPARSYEASVPWDTMIGMAILSLCSGIMCLAAILSYTTRELGMSDVFWLCLAPSVVSPSMAYVYQVPRRVVREADALVFQFLLGGSVTVPLQEVLELQVVDELWQFMRLLSRWSAFPYGSSLRLFRGLPTCLAPVCVLLTSRSCWSFAFCLEDLPTFLIDNQKPLDLSVRYRTGTKVLVREGESFASEEACNMRRGRWLRVKRQSGRRVLVTFETETSNVPRCDSCGKSFGSMTPVGKRCTMCGQRRQEDGFAQEGWMSYVSKNGYFLLIKEPKGVDSVGDYGGTKAGVMGASELARGYGSEPSSVEMPTMRNSAE